MSSHRRKRQRFYYHDSEPVNRAPTINNRQRENNTSNINEDDLKRYLHNEIQRRLEIKIQNCIKENGDIEVLKRDCRSMKQLERGLVTNAEQSANLPATTIQNFLNRYNRSHKTKSVEFWRRAVDNDFDNIVTQEKKKQQEQMSVDETDPVPSEVVNPAVNLASNYRTFTVPLNIIIRQDLPGQLKAVFKDRLSRTLEQSSDYITSFGLKLYQLMILFKDHSLVIAEDGNIVIQEAQGFSFQDILPTHFMSSHENGYVAPSISTTTTNSNDFNKQYKSLFNQNHLQLIHSSYLGPRGIQATSLQKNPIHKALLDTVPRQEGSQPDLDPFIMKSALSKYMINFSNMWSSTTRFKKLFNHLILVLLRLHLAPSREEKKRQYVQEKFNKKPENKGKTRIIQAANVEPIPVNKISLVNLSRNQKRNLFDGERRRCDKYIVKAETESVNLAKRDKWYQRADSCLNRIKTYNTILKNEVCIYLHTYK